MDSVELWVSSLLPAVSASTRSSRTAVCHKLNVFIQANVFSSNLNVCVCVFLRPAIMLTARLLKSRRSAGAHQSRVQLAQVDIQTDSHTYSQSELWAS